MRVALVCIAKNEDNYIKEWIEYNLKLGFDDVFIYQNNWYYPIKHENVYLIEINGYGKQVYAYNHFIASYYKEYDWVAFFDVDEFLVLKKHENVKRFIGDYKDHQSIGINWVLFGDNNLKFEGKYSILDRFTKRQYGVNKHIKCIIKMNPTIKYDVHCPINCHSVDTNYNTFLGPFNSIGDDNVAQLNHYYCKTKEEWFNKRNKGVATMNPNNPDFKRHDSDYDAHNFNNATDVLALNFFIKE